jgi:transcriptional regulator with AAA-type ATPase domain
LKENLMKPPLQMSALLDRGGKPSVRDLLTSLVFSPVDGTIRLNGDRLVMQRANVGQELRRQLVQLLGDAETRVFLIRLGYQLGRDDARFVRKSWPNLDIGDAFTAGTRLHMFSGVVRVETIHNDFDFAKRNFSGEFLWHDSLEAAECRASDLPMRHPVCWTQLGYAAGYASEFFGTLVVYKEVSCAAEGHKHCRVIGKPAEVWGESDPEVILFRTRVATQDRPETTLLPAESLGRAAVRPQRGSSAVDRILLAPVIDDLERLAASRLPVLISGAPGTGKKRAAAYLHTALGAEGTGPLRLHCGALGVDLLGQYLRPKPVARRKEALTKMLLLDDLELLPGDTQSYLAAYLGDTTARESVVVAATTALRPIELSRVAGFRPDLWLRFCVLPVCLTPLASRGDDLAALAEAMLSALADRIRVKRPHLDPGAIEFLGGLPMRGNLTELEAMLTIVMLAQPQGSHITSAALKSSVQNISGQLSEISDNESIDHWCDAAISTGSFKMKNFEARLYRAAVERANGNLSGAARSLGLSRAQLAYRLERAE